jgi:hypothetical protein
MLTMPSRQLHWPAAAALALIVGLPAIADAQLFPNLPIRRQRTPRCNEAPVFRLYRQEYFGYHPTCWRRFPDGWGCPSAEVPNSAQAMQDIVDEIKRQEQAFGAQPLTEGPPPAPGYPENMPPPNFPDTGLPELPTQPRQPFPLDTQPGLGQPPTDNLAPLPGGAAGAVPPGASAFEGPVEAPSTVDAGELSAPVGLLDVGNPSTPPVANATAADNLPWPAPPATNDPGAGPSTSDVAVGPGPGPAPFAGAFPDPVQAPQRRGILGSLFQNVNRRRR